MSWWNPWSENCRLRADLAESVAMEKNLRQAIAHCHSDLKRTRDAHNELQGKTFSLQVENERLKTKLRSVSVSLRDPRTGRFVPKDRVPA